MGLLRWLRALPLVGIVLLLGVVLIAVVVRFGFAELEPTESHSEQVELGRAVFLPPEWADAWRYCSYTGLLGMALILITPLLRYLPDSD